MIIPILKKRRVGWVDVLQSHQCAEHAAGPSSAVMQTSLLPTCGHGVPELLLTWTGAAAAEGLPALAEALPSGFLPFSAASLTGFVSWTGTMLMEKSQSAGPSSQQSRSAQHCQVFLGAGGRVVPGGTGTGAGGGDGAVHV